VLKVLKPPQRPVERNKMVFFESLNLKLNSMKIAIRKEAIALDVSVPKGIWLFRLLNKMPML
jgi:hypothetical protein